MRVLHLYAGNLFGGVETMLLTLARTPTPELEHHFGLGWTEARLGRALRELDASRVHALGPARLRSPLAVRRSRGALTAALRAARPDAVVCHSAWAQAMFGPTVRRAGLPLVFWLHDAAGRTLLERLAARTPPDAAVCTSRFVAGTLPALYPQVAATVIHPAVPSPPAIADSPRAAVRARLGASDGDVVLVQVARMEAWKGHGVLLEALGRLADEPGWRCWMVGGVQRPEESRYLQSLRERARALGIDARVAWLGESGDTRSLFAAADLCVQPNAAPEPFGMAMVEALYAGLPVIAADHGGAREVIDEHCGVRFPPGDAASLAEALRALLRDPAERARLGAAGPARAAALCDPRGRAAELLDLLRPLVAA